MTVEVGVAPIDVPFGEGGEKTESGKRDCGVGLGDGFDVAFGDGLRVGFTVVTFVGTGDSDGA